MRERAPVRDVVEAFGAAARRWPERPAVVCDGRVLSYAELAGRMGAAAEQAGAGVAGVLTARSADTVVAMLGVWAAGGTYCPVDPSFPPERRRAMLAAAGCRTIVEPGVEPGGPWLPGGPEWIGADPGPDRPAYILFTSGSTGAPKPVVTPRSAIAVVVEALRRLFGLTPADRVLQFASLNWDTCFEEILPALTTGAAVVFDGEAYTGSFPRFLRMVARREITVLDLPTAFWHELVHYLSETRAGLPGCLRLVIIGGEAVSPARLADWRALDTGRIRLLNTYGCTETTLITHAVDLHGPVASKRFDTPGGQIPIGWPLPHVVERIGADGELLIGGSALALGYRELPEETAARFVDTTHGRFFRTGDRVSTGPGGVLVYEGRLDGELKVRGVRVNPAEVEAHIAGCPGVAAVAVAGTTVADHTALVAYVLPRPHATVEAADVLSYLRGRAPAHLVPSRVRIVAELVHTASGKVDRARSHLRYASKEEQR